MHILLTRPRADSEALAEILRARGDRVLVEPLIHITPTGDAPSIEGVQAIVATSANGIRALADTTRDRDLPVFAVGDATARAARDAGFARVESASGDSAALARLVAARTTPMAGALLHVRGRDVAGDLAGALEAEGFEVRSAVLYAARAATGLSAPARDRVAAGEIDAILFFSPRTARTFVSLARDAGIAEACEGITALCLSPAVADAASPLPWRELRVAASPDQAALIKELDFVAAKPEDGRTVTDSNEKKDSPSTLEKAVARDEEDRRARADNGGNGEAGAEATAEEPRRHRSPALWTAAVLAVLLVLAGIWITWPGWGPALPGWLHASLAPVMNAGRGTGADSRMDALAGRLDALERSVADTRAALEARPQIDPSLFDRIAETARTAAERTEAIAGQLESLREHVAGAGQGGDVQALETRLSELENRIAALSARPGSEEATQALDALRSQSAERMAQLERDNLALRRTVAALEDRIAAAEERPAAPVGTSRENALVLAVGQLREAARDTDPFAASLSAVEALAGEDPSLQQPIEALRPVAQQGAPDLTALRLRFDRIAGEIAREAFVPKGEGWIDRTLQSLARIVTIRRSDRDAAARDDENGRVARAELRLAAGDLAGAVEALDGLTGRAAAVAEPWLKDARTRLAVNRAIGTLYAEALRRTGGKGTPPGSPSGAGRG